MQPLIHMSGCHGHEAPLFKEEVNCILPICLATKQKFVSQLSFTMLPYYLSQALRLATMFGQINPSTSLSIKKEHAMCLSELNPRQRKLLQIEALFHQTIIAYIWTNQFRYPFVFSTQP